METLYREREKIKAKQIEAKITREIKLTHKREIKEMGKKAKEIANFKIQVEKQKMDNRIIKIEQSKNSLFTQLSSQKRTISDLEKQNTALQTSYKKKQHLR
jgi:hypothetical protein